MRAVADTLGVDRKSLNYHVRDRDGLLELLALDRFNARFAHVVIPREDWAEACTTFALGMADSLVETGELFTYFTADSSTLDAVEAVLEALERAGFDDELAKRGLILLTTIAMGFARDAILASRFGEHPQHSEIRRGIASDVAEGVPHPFMSGPEMDSVGDEQRTAALEIFLLGMKQKLLDRTGAT